MICDYSTDIPCIEAYNERRKPLSPYRLQVHMGPAPHDGDPTTAKIILLLNNPRYDPKTSNPKEHCLAFDGWPLAGLHPDAPKSFRDWYSRPFGHLIHARGASWVSNSVAILQVNPWASESFDAGLLLPSRKVQFGLARDAGKRGAVLISGRSHCIWAEALDGQKVHRARNVRNPTVSPKGLEPDGWDAVLNILNSQD